MLVTPRPCLEHHGGVPRVWGSLLPFPSSLLISCCPSFWPFLQVVLIQGRRCLPGVTWQCLETFFVVTIEEVCHRDRQGCQTSHNAHGGHSLKNYSTQMSAVPRWRNPVVYAHVCSMYDVYTSIYSQTHTDMHIMEIDSHTWGPSLLFIPKVNSRRSPVGLNGCGTFWRDNSCHQWSAVC